KITALDLKNFVVWKDATLTFDKPVNLLFGLNGSGKTSCATAIEVLLTGRAARFEGHRLGLAALIGPAGDTAEVVGTIEADGKTWEITRRITAKGLLTIVNGHEATRSVYDYYSPTAMRDPEAAWRAVLTVGGVLDAEPAAQK